MVGCASLYCADNCQYYPRIQKAGVAGVLGLAGASNVQGEQQKKLDVIANDVFVNLLRKSGQCCMLVCGLWGSVVCVCVYCHQHVTHITQTQVSEEEEELIIIDDRYKGQYAVVFDPLDGSSNIECGVSIGSIFGVYHVENESHSSVEDVLQVCWAFCCSTVYPTHYIFCIQPRMCISPLVIIINIIIPHHQPGRKMVAAGYCMYGSCCNLVLSLGSGVYGFTLDPSLGEFVLTHENIRVPSSSTIYSINEGNAATWNEATRQFVEECKNPPGGGKPKSLRYVGSMVADVHRTLLYGGSFLYPADKKSPNGKLRLLYEVCSSWVGSYGEQSIHWLVTG